MIAIPVDMSTRLPRAPRLDVMKEICRRIVPLISSHPEILKRPSAALLLFPDLFLDLNPTLSEVALAVETAIGAWETLRKDLEKH